MPYNVMVVEDNRQTANYIADMLRLLGHTVLPLFTPRSAMRQLNEVVPDVIFVDVNLPGIDGFEVCRYLRRDPATQRLPIVVISAHSERSYKEMAVQAGANLYLVKPVGLEELQRALVSVLETPSASG